MENKVKQTRLDEIHMRENYEPYKNATLDGAVAVMITDRFSYYTNAIWEETVAGVTIHYNNGNYIVVWKDDAFYNLKEAYS